MEQLKQVAGFYESSLIDLQKAINIWIAENHKTIDVLDIKYQAIYNNKEDNEYFTALVIFSGII